MSHTLGVDIGGTDVKLGILSAQGEILERGKIPTRAGEGPPAVASRVSEWLGTHGALAASVRAVGVGCAGLIDGNRGWLYTSPNLPGWTGIPLASIFEAELDRPVLIENDANSAAYGEHRKGAGVGTNNFVALTLGTGVGGGVVLGGALYRGSAGFAGEIGHHVIDLGGPPCGCGKRGCLEALIKAQAIVERALAMARSRGADRPGWDERLTVESIHRCAAGGDELAAEALAETGRLLGIGLSNVIHIFDPDAIAIGGGVAGAGDFILEPARATVRDCYMDAAMSHVRIVPALLGNAASFIGAALLAQSGAGRPR
jgi:glucokinase